VVGSAICEERAFSHRGLQVGRLLDHGGGVELAAGGQGEESKCERNAIRLDADIMSELRFSA